MNASTRGDERDQNADRAEAFRDHVLRAMRLADASALELITCGGHPAQDESWRIWLDVGPLLDDREYSGQLLDLNRLAIEHALDRKLIERHPRQAHLVRVLLNAAAEWALRLVALREYDRRHP